MCNTSGGSSNSSCGSSRGGSSRGGSGNGGSVSCSSRGNGGLLYGPPPHPFLLLFLIVFTCILSSILMKRVCNIVINQISKVSK